MAKTDISRRSFLGLSGAAIAGAAVAGAMPATAVAAEEEAAVASVPVAESGASAGPDVQGMHAWEIAPEPIPADEITDVVETDVLVIGAGLGGCCATIAALEEGANVITIDKNQER